jgi:hypothetical protein
MAAPQLGDHLPPGSDPTAIAIGVVDVEVERGVRAEVEGFSFIKPLYAPVARHIHRQM